MKRILMVLMLMPMMAVAETLSEALVAWYKFDGDTADTKANWNTLTAESSISYIADRNGDAGKAVRLDGTGCLYGNMEHDVTNQFTFACWFKAEIESMLVNESTSGISGTSNSSKFLDGGSSYPIAVGTNGINVFEHGSFHLPAIFKYDSEIGTGWNHLAMSVNGDGIVVYLNGTEIGRRSRAGTDWTVSIGEGGWDSGSAQRYVGIGSMGYGGHFQGGVDEVRVYNRVLSAAEVKAVYNDNQPRTFYVNGATGSDENSGRSADVAKATIQAAIDTAADGSTIIVADGIYDAISVGGFRGIVIKSVSGAQSTIIDGNNATTVANLNSNDSSANTGATVNQLIGFTLQNGTSGARGNGALKCGLARNCIFRYNYGTGYGGGSVAAGGCVFINCIAYENRYGVSWGGGVFANCLVVNCTLYNNTGYGVWDGDIYNTVSYGNSQGDYRSSGRANTFHNCLTAQIWDSGLGNITGDPKFSDAANADFSLSGDSPCINSGSSDWYSGLKWYDDYSLPQEYFATDFYGNPRVAGGKVDMGAIEYDSLPPKTDGLVAWYKFDGDAKDSSGYNNDLTNKGAVATSDRHGRANGAMYLDGKSCIASIAEKIVLAKESGTLAGWFKAEEAIERFYPESTSGTYYSAPYAFMPLSGGNASEQYWLWAGVGFALGTNGVMVYEHTGQYLPTPLVYEGTIGNDWTHVCITYHDNGEESLYINGCFIKSGLKSTKSKCIGFDDDGGIGGFGYGHFTGSVDDIRIYERALSAEEVKALYDSEKVDGLLHRWSFNGSLLDSVSGMAATSSGSYSWTGDGKSISLPGGERGTSGIDLGSYLLPTNGTPMTIEIWAKNHANNWWSRIIDIGYGSQVEWPKLDSFFMSWNRDGNENSDRIELQTGGIVISRADDSLSGFELDKEYHISIVVKPNPDTGKTTFIFAKRSADTGSILSLSSWSIDAPWNVALHHQEETFIGRSINAEEWDAAADYNEVRIWGRALSADELTTNAKFGPDVLPIVRTVTFDANGGTCATDSVKVLDRVAIGELPTAERSGHKFLGWFTEKNEGAQITSETIITTNVTFYAHWFDTSIGNVTGATNVLWRTGGDAVWATEEAEDGWDVRSGTIGKNSETWIECVVTNGCRVSFEWRVSCEPEDEGEMYDFLSFSVDGDQKAVICGESVWTTGAFCVSGAGEHILRWTYQKDYRTSEGEDCGWLGKVWVDPEVAVTFEGNGATSGEVPTIATAYLGDTITIPGTGTLAKRCHAFGGWQCEGKIYFEGESLEVAKVAMTFVAVWKAKVLGAVTLQTPETLHVTTEKIGVSFNMPENATTIRYTLDGSEPTIQSAVYVGPFEVADRSVTVKAIACADDWFESVCATWELTRAPWSAPECLNVETRSFAFGGNADWVRDLDVTHDGEAAMRSGAIGDKQKSLISMSVNGAGSVSFWCKVSSECDPDDGTVYDGLAVLVDGEEVYDDLIGGEVDWTNITVEVAGEGGHTIGWRYEKDKTGKSGDDCAWLDEILWQADETVVTASETGGKDVVIGREWIERDLVERYGAGRTEAFRNKYGTDYDLAVRKLSGKTFNGKPASVWQDYVAGTDPTDTNSVFASSIEVVGGVPIVTWKPDLKSEREYKIWGSTNLANSADWHCPTNALDRFFKVTVEMK